MYFMKSISSILTLLLFSSVLAGQTVSVSATKMNVFYIGVNNPLTIVVENIDCKDLIVKVTNGEIVGDSCYFTFRYNDTTVSSTNTIVIIGVNQETGTKWIDSLEYRVKQIPDPIPTIDWDKIPILRENGLEYYQTHFNGNESMTLSIIPKMVNFVFDTNFIILRYSLKITRQDSILLDSKQNYGNIIPKDIFIKYFIEGSEGDKVIVYDIIAKGEDLRIRKLETIEYILK